MDELADSASLVNDQGGLRRRLAEDGYLFFRGLLPAGQIRAAGRAVLDRLRNGGWVDDRAIPGARDVAVGQPDVGAVLNTLMGAFAGTFSVPSAWALG